MLAPCRFQPPINSFGGGCPPVTFSHGFSISRSGGSLATPYAARHCLPHFFCVHSGSSPWQPCCWLQSRTVSIGLAHLPTRHASEVRRSMLSATQTQFCSWQAPP